MSSIKPVILVVEDEYFLYENFRGLLSEEGYEVLDYSPSVKEAIKQIKTNRPDLVLLDIKLQGAETGIDLAHKLNKEYKIPFIYITEFSDRSTFRKALATSPELYLVKTKPVLEKDNLLLNIAAILSKLNDKKRPVTQPLGVTGLVDYKDVIKDYDLKTVSKVQVPFSEILFFSTDVFENENGRLEEVRTNYLWFMNRKGEVFFMKKSLNELGMILPYNFVRINQKYIVNILSDKFLGRINGATIKIWDRELNISSTYKDEFNKRMAFYFPE